MASISQFCFHQTCRTASSACDLSSYRDSLHYRSLCTSNSFRTCVACQGSDDGLASRDNQKPGFFKSQLSHWRCQSSLRGSRKDVAVPQATSSGGNNNPETFKAQTFSSKAFSLSQMVPTSLQNFPWDKAYAGLNRRISDLLLILWKWVSVPLLVVMALNEITFTVSVGKELFIPIGLLAGSVLAGILTEMALTLSNDFQESMMQWYLVEIGVFFALMKIAGVKCLKYSYWASALLLHFANGGLWQTIRFSARWKRSKAEMSDAEERGSIVGQRQAFDG